MLPKLPDGGVKTNGEADRAMFNDVLPPLEETLFIDENDRCF